MTTNGFSSAKTAVQNRNNGAMKRNGTEVMGWNERVVVVLKQKPASNAGLGMESEEKLENREARGLAIHGLFDPSVVVG